MQISMDMSSKIVCKRTVPEDQEPVLIVLDKNNPIIGDIRVDKSIFKIGRSRDSNIIIADVLISRNHAVLKLDKNGDWWITHLSSTVTVVNDTPLEKDVPKKLSHGDMVQFSASDEFKFVFTLCSKVNESNKKQRVDQSLLETVLTQQKSFAENQENKRKELEEKLQLRQSEQTELRSQLDKLLKEQELSQGHTQELTNQIADLQRHIKAGNEAELQLQQMYNQLLSTLEKERIKFEKRLNEERKKWQEALDLSKQEKETVEKSMKEQMNKWREQQQAEWAIVMENLVRQEKTAHDRLLIEKNQLAQKLKETEDALKEQAAITEQLQSTAIENERHVIAEVSQHAGQECFVVQLLNDGTTGEMEILETIDLTVDSPSVQTKTDDGELSKVGVIMDEQFACSVCSELFINAVTLNCTHSFCQHCIRSWMKRKRDCPICRAAIVSVNRSIALDGFIDVMVENLSPELKARRNQILKDRKASEKPTGPVTIKRKKRANH